MATSWWNRFLKSKFRPAARRRPARARLGLEQLETRLVPSVTINVVNGQLQVLDGDTSAHTIALTHTGPANGFAETFVFVDGQRFFNSSDDLITAGIVINTENDTATVNILANVQPTTITGQGGNNIVNLGTKGNVQAIQAPVSVLNSGSGAGTELKVDDSNDPVARDVTMGVSKGTDTITGLAPATISYGANDVRSVIVDGGSGGNTFTVADTALNSRARFIGTDIHSGDGDDAVNVLQTSGPLDVDTGGSTFFDQVNIGNAHSVQGIHGAVTVASSNFASVVLDDSADQTGQHATVTVSDVERIQKLAPAPIFFFGSVPNATFDVEIDPGSSNNTFDVQGLFPNTSLDFVGGNSTVNVGSPLNTLDTIRGQVRIDGGSGTTTVNVNDQGSMTASHYLTGSGGNAVQRQNPDGTSVGTVIVNSLNPAGMVAVNLQGGSGANTFDVLDTAFGITTSIRTGPGNDTVNVQATTGPVSIAGQGGVLAINVGQNFGKPNSTVEFIKSTVPVSNPNGSFDLAVDDAGGPATPNVTLGVNAQQLGFISDLAPAMILYAQGAANRVDVSGPQTATTYTITDTAKIQVTSLSTGNGKDTVDVLATTTQLFVDTQGAPGATVNIGTGHSVQSIHGELDVRSENFCDLFLDDSADKIGRSVTIADFGINNLAPALIAFFGSTAGNFVGVTIDAGSGTNTFDVQQLAANAQVDINGFTGNGNTTVNVGSAKGTLDPIQGHISVFGRGGTTTVNVNDQGSTTANQYVTDDGSSVARLNPDGTLVGPVFADSFDPTGQVVVNLFGGSGANTFNLPNTSSDITTSIHTGPGTEIVNVFGTSGPTSITGQGGSLNVTVGVNPGANIDTVELIKGTLSLSDPNGRMELAIADTGGPAAPTVTLGVNAAQQGFISGLAPAQILYAEGDVTFVNIFGPQTATTYTITDTASSNHHPVTDLSPGNGKDTVDVLGTTGVLGIEFVTGAGSIVNIGNAHSVQGIHGPVDILSGTSTSVVVDDSADKTGRSATISSGSVQNLAPAEILFQSGTNGSFNVTVDAGSGNNTFDVQAILPNVQLNLFGGSGRNMVNVGSASNTLDTIQGRLNFHDGGGTNTVMVNDQGSTTPNAYTVNVDVFRVSPGGSIVGQVSVDTTTTAVARNNLALNAGSGANTFSVFDTAQGFTTTLHTGNGNDIVNVQGTTGPLTIDAGTGKDNINVGSTANTLDGIQGILTVNGNSSGFDTLNINDQGSTTKHTYTQTANSLSRSGAAEIFFANIAKLQVNKGPVLGIVAQAKDLAVTKVIRVGQYATLSSRLVDKNASAKLTLVVDWGDGSKPQTFTPGQAPFHLKHKYHKAGHYTVRVIWTDLTSQESESQDLHVTVKS
jgi:hypothetical protein